MLCAGNDRDLLDARIQQCLERVMNQRPVVDRQEALIRDLREGTKARAGAAADKNSFH